MLQYHLKKLFCEWQGWSHEFGGTLRIGLLGFADVLALLRKDMRFVGANDPGTSVGTLLELARVLSASQEKPKLTYWLVFFDGEEALCEEWLQCHNPNPSDPENPLPDNTYGSRHYVSTLRENNELGRVRALVLMDLIGSKDLELGRDTMSTRWLQDIVWHTARDLGYEKYFVERVEPLGGDDHEPFLKSGVDSLDLIQLRYRYWHRADDTLDKVSAQSMKIVGEVVLASLPKIAERVGNARGKGRTECRSHPSHAGGLRRACHVFHARLDRGALSATAAPDRRRRP